MATEAELASVRELYERFNRGELDEGFEILHPDAELHQNPEFPDGGVYLGREEFRRGLNIFLEQWEDFSFEPIDTEAGERVWIRVRLATRGKTSGVPLELTVFHVWDLKDGKPFRCRVFLDEADSRAAARLPR